MAHCNEKRTNNEMIPLSLLENANAKIFTAPSIRCLEKLSRIKKKYKMAILISISKKLSASKQSNIGKPQESRFWVAPCIYEIYANFHRQNMFNLVTDAIDIHRMRLIFSLL